MLTDWLPFLTLSLGVGEYGLIMKIGGGLVLGFIIGYLVRKAIVFLLFCGGISIAGIWWMNTTGLITINQRAIEQSLFSMKPMFTGNLSLIISLCLLTISFLIGLAIGFKSAGES